MKLLVLIALISIASVNALFLRPIPKSIPYAPVTNAKLAPCNITYYLYQAIAVTPQNYLKVQLNTSMYCNKKSCVGAANPRGFDPTIVLFVGQVMDQTKAVASCSPTGTGTCQVIISCSYVTGPWYIGVAGGQTGINLYNMTAVQNTVVLGPQVLTGNGVGTITPSAPNGALGWTNYTNIWSNFTDRYPCFNQKPCDPINGNMYWKITTGPQKIGQFMTVFLTNLKVNNAAIDATKFVLRLLKGALPVAKTGAQENCVGGPICVANFEKHDETNYVYQTCQCSPNYVQPGTGGSGGSGTVKFNYCNMTVSPCGFTSGDWYLGLNYPQLGTNFKFNFSVHADLYAPVVTPLTKDSVLYEELTTNGVDHHYLLQVPTDGSVSPNSYLIVTVDNVNGGQVNVWVNPGKLAGSNVVPTAQRTGGANANLPQPGWWGPEGCFGNKASCTTLWACNVVVQPCDFAAWNAQYNGQWYIAVHTASPTNLQQLPIEYKLHVTWASYDAPAVLPAGVPLFPQISESLYQFYQFNVVPSPNTYLFVELYIETLQATLGASTGGQQLEMYMEQNFGINGLLPGGHCFGTDDAKRAFNYYCKAQSSGGMTSCNFMIKTCELAQGPLFISVFGTPWLIQDKQNAYYTKAVPYTIWADYDQPRQITNGTSYTETTYLNHYNHYFIYIDPELYNNGDQLIVEYEDVTGGSIQGYVQKNTLAGACPCWTNLKNCTNTYTPPCLLNGPPPTTWAGVNPYCMIQMSSCDFTPGLWYISAQGTAASASSNEIGYTMRATWMPRPPISSLWTTQVEDNVVGLSEYRHYVVEVDNTAVTTRLNNLVFKLVAQEFSAKTASLMLYVQRDRLAIGACSDFQCTANWGGFTYCTLKVPFCQLYNGTRYTFYASVYGSAAEKSCCGNSTRYTLEAQLEPEQISTLPNGDWQYGRVKEDRYVHYVIPTQGFTAAPGTYMYVELYLNQDQANKNGDGGKAVTLFMNINAPAGGNWADTKECFQWINRWNVTKSFSFMLQPCELTSGPANYFFSVYGMLGGGQHQFFDRAQEYTFRVSLRALPRQLTLNQPVSGWVYVTPTTQQWNWGPQVPQQRTTPVVTYTDQLHYVVNVPSAQNWQYLEFTTSTVQYGTVTTYYNFNKLAGACPCYTNQAQCPEDFVAQGKTYTPGQYCITPPRAVPLPTGLGTTSLLQVPNCVLKKQLGNYYFSVKALTQAANSDLPVGFTVKPSLRTPNFTSYTSLAIGYGTGRTTIRSNVMLPNRYWHWAITVPAAIYTNNTVLVVNISSVQGGTLRMLYNGPKQALPAEWWPSCYLRDFGVVSGQKVLQIEPCDFGVGTVYVSLRSLSNQLSMSYEFTAYVKQPIQLPLGGTGLTNQAFFNLQWEQYFVVVPAPITDATILSIEFINVTRNGFSVMWTRDAPAGPPVDTSECLACTTSMFTPTTFGASYGNYNLTVWNCRMAAGVYWLRISPQQSGTTDPKKPDTFIARLKSQLINTNPSPVALSIGTGALSGTNPATGSYQAQIPFSWRQYTFQLTAGNFPTGFPFGKLRLTILPIANSGTGTLAFYINPAKAANAGCNEWSCVSKPTDTCSGTPWQLPPCCNKVGQQWYIGVQVSADPENDQANRGAKFTFQINTIPEQTVNLALPAPSSSSNRVPFAQTTAGTGVRRESYHHYRFNMPAANFAQQQSIIFNVTRPSTNTAGTLSLYVTKGYFAGLATESGGCYQASQTCNFDVNSNCLLQYQPCQVSTGDWFFSIYNPSAFVPTVAEATKEYTGTVEMWDTTPISLGVVGSGGDSSTWVNTTYWGKGTRRHYSFVVTQADVLAQRWLQVQLAQVTSNPTGGAVTLEVCYGRPCGCPFGLPPNTLRPTAVATNCGGASGQGACVVTIKTCDGANRAGTWYVSIALDASVNSIRYSLRARMRQWVYNPIPTVTAPVALSARWNVSQPVATGSDTTRTFYYTVQSLTTSPQSNLIVRLDEVTSGKTATVTVFNQWCQRWTCTTGDKSVTVPGKVTSGCILDMNTSLVTTPPNPSWNPPYGNSLYNSAGPWWNPIWSGGMTPCALKGGNWFFEVTRSDPATKFTLSVTRYDPVIRALSKNVPVYAEVLEHEWQHWSFQISNVSIGTILRPTIQVECGRVDVYLNYAPLGGTFNSGPLCNRYSCSTSAVNGRAVGNPTVATCGTSLYMDTCEVNDGVYYISVHGSRQNWLDPWDKLNWNLGGNVNYPIGYIINVDYVTETRVELALCKDNFFGSYQNASVVVGGGACDPRTDITKTQMIQTNENAQPACNGQGTCRSGNCECNPGWVGAKCDKQVNTFAPFGKKDPYRQFYFDLENMEYGGVLNVEVWTSATTAWPDFNGQAVAPSMEMKRNIVPGTSGFNNRCAPSTICGSGASSCTAAGTYMKLTVPPCNLMSGRYYLNIQWNDWVYIKVTRVRATGRKILSDVEYSSAIADENDWHLYKLEFRVTNMQENNYFRADMKNWRVLMYNVNGTAKVAFSAGIQPNWADQFAACPYPSPYNSEPNTRSCQAAGVWNGKPIAKRLTNPFSWPTKNYWTPGECIIGLGPCTALMWSDQASRVDIWWFKVTAVPMANTCGVTPYTLRIATTVNVLPLNVGTYRCDRVGRVDRDWITGQYPSTNYYMLVPNAVTLDSRFVTQISISGLTGNARLALTPAQFAAQARLTSPYVANFPYTAYCGDQILTTSSSATSVFFCPYNFLTVMVDNQVNFDQMYQINASYLLPNYNSRVAARTPAWGFGQTHCESCPTTSHGDALGYDWYTLTTPSTIKPNVALWFEVKSLGANAGTGAVALGMNEGGNANIDTGSNRCRTVGRCFAASGASCQIWNNCGVVNPGTTLYLSVRSAGPYCLSSGQVVASFKTLRLSSVAQAPTPAPTTQATTAAPTTVPASTAVPTTAAPTTAAPTTVAPTTAAPTTAAPTTAAPTTAATTTAAPTTAAPTTAAPTTAPPATTEQPFYCYSWEFTGATPSQQPEISQTPSAQITAARIQDRHWYTFTLQQAQLVGDYRDYVIDISIYNAYGATYTIAVNSGDAASVVPNNVGTSCAIVTGTVASGKSSTTVTVPNCGLKAGVFYMTISWTADTCNAAAPGTFGSAQPGHNMGYCVSATLNEPSPVRPTMLSSGVAVSSSFADANAPVQWYRYNLRRPQGQYPIVQVQIGSVANGAVTVLADGSNNGPNCQVTQQCTSGAGTFERPESCATYLLFCEIAGTDAIWLSVFPASQAQYQTAIQYQITVTEYDDFKPLAVAPTTFAATNYQDTFGFYKVVTPRPQSVRVAGVVSDVATATVSGQYVNMQVWNQPCRGYFSIDSINNWYLNSASFPQPQYQNRYVSTQQCYRSGEKFGSFECEWESSSEVENWSYQNNYFVVVEAVFASIQLTATVGTQNCAVPPAAALNFCSQVNYATWSWQDASMLDGEAQCLYEQLKDNFWCTNCDCGYTDLCDSSLRTFACNEVFRQCETDTGYQLKQCRNNCQATVQYCANWFQSTSSSMKLFNCTSDRFDDRQSKECTGAASIVILPRTQYTNVASPVSLVDN